MVHVVGRLITVSSMVSATESGVAWRLRQPGRAAAARREATGEPPVTQLKISTRRAWPWDPVSTCYTPLPGPKCPSAVCVAC